MTATEQAQIERDRITAGDGVTSRPPDCPQCHQSPLIPGTRCGTCGLVFSRDHLPAALRPAATPARKTRKPA
jgi:hypothetical protein